MAKVSLSSSVRLVALIGSPVLIAYTGYVVSDLLRDFFMTQGESTWAMWTSAVTLAATALLTLGALASVIMKSSDAGTFGTFKDFILGAIAALTVTGILYSEHMFHVDMLRTSAQRHELQLARLAVEKADAVAKPEIARTYIASKFKQPTPSPAPVVTTPATPTPSVTPSPSPTTNTRTLEPGQCDTRVWHKGPYVETASTGSLLDSYTVASEGKAPLPASSMPEDQWRIGENVKICAVNRIKVRF